MVVYQFTSSWSSHEGCHRATCHFHRLLHSYQICT